MQFTAACLTADVYQVATGKNGNWLSTPRLHYDVFLRLNIRMRLSHIISVLLLQQLVELDKNWQLEMGELAPKGRATDGFDVGQATVPKRHHFGITQYFQGHGRMISEVAGFNA